MVEGDLPFRDPREAWFSPYRGTEFGIAFKWLCGGAALYALLLLVMMAGKPGEATWPVVGPSLYLTPLYGLPYVLATVNKPGRTRRMLYFILLLPLAHVAANYAAFSYAARTFDLELPGVDVQRDLVAGALGGLTGAVLAFALLALVRLTAPDRRHLPVMILGTVLLAAIGAAAMAAGLQWTDALRRPDDPGRAIIWYETVHLPWQLAFALLLAWLMRRKPEPRRKRARPAPAAETPES